MTVEVEIVGRGRFAGLRSNIVGYSVNEDATPIDGSDTAAVGELSFSVVEDPSPDGTMQLLGSQITLSDTRRGATVGIVDSINSNNGIAQIRASSRLNLLVIDGKAEPFVGTFEGAMRYYLGLAGVVESVNIDVTLGSTPVALQGWEGSIWKSVLRLCIAHRAEIQQVAANIVVRPIRQFEAVMNRNSSEEWSIDNTQRAQTVQIAYYNNEYRANGLAYPSPWESYPTNTYRVDSGRMVEDVIEVPATLRSVSQPQPMSGLTPEYSGIVSAYSVRNEDGPITAAAWTAAGGRVTAEVGKETGTVVVRIYAPPESALKGPFEIADASERPSLFLVGDGVFYHRELLTLSTGADPSNTSQILGETVDFQEVSTLAQAWTIGLHAAAKWGVPRQAINITTISINRKGETGDYSYLTWGEFDTTSGSAVGVVTGDFGTGAFGTTPFGENPAAPATSADTWGEFDAAWDEYTWGGFDEYWTEQSKDDFTNQGFGNMTGAAARFRDGIYRITSHRTDDVTVTYTAEQDSLFSDVEALWDGSTWGEFDDFWQYNTWGDIDTTPLKSREQPTNEPVFRTVVPSLLLMPQMSLLPGE